LQTVRERQEEGRISRCFRALQERGEGALIAYVAAGDPSLEATRRIVIAMAQAGADLVELGIPFSDPLMDGPVIQAASQRALDGGTRVSQIFETVEAIRAKTDVPMIFMTCLNPILRMGPEAFARRCQQTGMDGVLVTDLPPEEGQDWIEVAEAHQLDRIFMLAPTSSPERIAAVTTAASGFIYCQSRAGVTGERKNIPVDLGALVSRVRAASSLPIAVGFGIATPEHVHAVTSLAEGAVVGTAIVRAIAQAGGNEDQAVRAAADLVAQLKSGAHNPDGARQGVGT
jgi:tryptophan synthase alpha chain